MTRQPGRDDSTRTSGMIGSVYLEYGQPVTVLARWATPAKVIAPFQYIWHRPPGSAPHNVLIDRVDGTLVVRPFRDLRKSGPAQRVIRHGSAHRPGVVP